MPQISLDDPKISFPLTIGNGPSENGPRLGGRAPAAARPSDATFQYFFTVPLPGFEAEEVSVFVSPDFEALLQTHGILASAGAVEVVRHPVDCRSDAGGPNDSPLTAHPLVLGESSPDIVVVEDHLVPYSGHKMGGLPYFVEGEPSLEDPVQGLLRAGFVHLVQIDFPGNEGDADVSGPWPIGTGIIHLLARWNAEQFEWAWFWEL